MQRTAMHITIFELLCTFSLAVSTTALRVKIKTFFLLEKMLVTLNLLADEQFGAQS